ncbi:MAG: LAGLIDADG homing endonuclease [Parcubacteria group bacterium GW2011_GWC1_38_17]|nr:MAG: LAGLIDADG homing endonuclease [Parcubacteria group bacterium GW2011_GWC1_38_17]KKQ59177.1 MAG: Homing endonuclease [Parcubacteria group bacterium GW2011_GWD1_38_16]
MGSRTKITANNNWAYVAGFFDGDGSLMVQFKNRRESVSGFRPMITICFYQDKRHSNPLKWFRKLFGIGYLSERNDGMTELRINGYDSCEKILKNMKPFIKFKKKQVELALKIISKLKKVSNITPKVILEIAKISDKISQENYSSKTRKYSYEYFEKLFKK